MFKAEKTVNDIFYFQIPINANTLPPRIDEVKLSEVQLLRVRVTFHTLPHFIYARKGYATFNFK